MGEKSLGSPEGAQVPCFKGLQDSTDFSPTRPTLSPDRVASRRAKRQRSNSWAVGESGEDKSLVGDQVRQEKARNKHIFLHGNIDIFLHEDIDFELQPPDFPLMHLDVPERAAASTSPSLPHAPRTNTH